MEVDFANDDYDRLETDLEFTNGLDGALVKSYRKRMQGLRAALDERDIHQFKSWHFEKLKGDRQYQHSIRLNDQFRLILEIVEAPNGKQLRVIGIEDYH